MANQSTFNAAIPYTVAALGTAAIGVGVALSTTSLALTIIGVAAGVFGSVATFGIIACGFMNAGNPQKFREELPKYVGPMVAAFTAEIIKNIALEIISSLVHNALGDNSRTYRQSHI
jgi:Flp pilus assembly protein TadB